MNQSRYGSCNMSTNLNLLLSSRSKPYLRSITTSKNFGYKWGYEALLARRLSCKKTSLCSLFTCKNTDGSPEPNLAGMQDLSSLPLASSFHGIRIAVEDPSPSQDNEFSLAPVLRLSSLPLDTVITQLEVLPKSSSARNHYERQNAAKEGIFTYSGPPSHDVGTLFSCYDKSIDECD
ncbi:hypothetical protein SCHPADRAFT_87143 [Schizopora paradoxa]|uniref:Uncharacterized protein n=1 Tax=Schizopora paradoxa TaxID=27342 RepID=A0A0H2SPP2_9AGAM|nr:hypothetical protein SCHPADRAFT_87143 [Schizopora paradoxa]